MVINKNHSISDSGSLSSIIDHTLLKPDATPADVIRLCHEAVQYKFASVCINPCYVVLAGNTIKKITKGMPGTAICTVAGFPFGSNTTESKVFEAFNSAVNGATEIDMVINIGMLKSGDTEYVLSDIKAVVDAVRGKAIVKVIIEACLLTDDEIVSAAIITKDAGAAFVKTSTGLSKGGATVENVALLRRTVGDAIKVKAAGGIRDFKTAVEMVNAGADRLGTSSGIAIISGIKGCL